MRIPALAIALVLVASCGGTGPVDPPASIAGSWSSWPPGYCCNPAGPETLVLTESGITVTGTDSWAIRHDSISGQYEIPNVRLNLVGGPQVIVYTGQAIHPDRMVLNGTTYYKQ